MPGDHGRRRPTCGCAPSAAPASSCARSNAHRHRQAGAKGAAAQGKQAPATAAGASPYKAALESSGINERTAQRWQELAGVPKEKFEAALRDPERKPTTTGVLAPLNGAPKMDDDALWLWGRLRDFERWLVVDRIPGELFQKMTATMQADVRRIVPLVTDWLDDLKRQSR